MKATSDILPNSFSSFLPSSVRLVSFRRWPHQADAGGHSMYSLCTISETWDNMTCSCSHIKWHLMSLAWFEPLAADIEAVETHIYICINIQSTVATGTWLAYDLEPALLLQLDSWFWLRPPPPFPFASPQCPLQNSVSTMNHWTFDWKLCQSSILAKTPDYFSCGLSTIRCYCPGGNALGVGDGNG